MTNLEIANTYNDWINKVHSTAKAKGWWETKRSELEISMLIRSEVFEAFEELRKDTPMIYQNQEDNDTPILPGMSEWRDDLKPEGFLVELADVIIRIGDYAGYSNFLFNENMIELFKTKSGSVFFNDVWKIDNIERQEGYKQSNRLRMLHDIDRQLIEALRYEGIVHRHFISTAMILSEWCFIHELDLSLAIELKMIFNETRSHRHGGKKI